MRVAELSGFWAGASLPPGPIRTAAGTGWFSASTVNDARSISVRLRLGPVRLLGRNSVTVPVTPTDCPTSGFAPLAPVNT